MDSLRWIAGGVNLFAAAVIILLAVPLVRRRVAPNKTYGVRTQRTFASEEAWYAINAYGGRELILWSLPVALVGLAALLAPAQEESWPYVVGSMAPLIYALPCWRMHLFAKRWQPE